LKRRAAGMIQARGFGKAKIAHARGKPANHPARGAFPDLAERRETAFWRAFLQSAMMTTPRAAILLPLALLLCQCGVPSPPQCVRVPRASNAPAASLIEIARAEWAVLTNPARRHEWNDSRANYNTAVAKLFDQLRCGPDGWDARAAAIGCRISRNGDEIDPSAFDALIPSASVKNGKISQRRVNDGLGVPAVGWKQTSPVGQKRERFLLPNGLPYNLTVVLAFERGSPVWRFIKRWKQEQIDAGSAVQPLAADWSAPNEFYWSMCQLDDLLLQNVFLPDRFTEETSIYFLQPYDPEKIPLVFVHGLVSSPDAFKNTINALAPEPWIRERYQIWLYNYPTGNPWTLSGMNFREKMREACAYARGKGHDRNLNRMVVVAHSMGGLLARSSVTDPGTTMYDGVFRKPIGDLPVSERTRELIRKGLLYEPLTEPERVVFMAVPHRGSPIATCGPSQWIARLIRLPKDLTIDLLDQTLLAAGDVLRGEDPTDRLPNSINSLSPKNRSTISLNKLPLPKDITFHSIIGDRGKGDTPNSSDGVVPYWSSHVAPVASEKIVPSNHGVPDHPQAAEELKRILKLHLGSSAGR
jgi:hypothetical protein